MEETQVSIPEKLHDALGVAVIDANTGLALSWNEKVDRLYLALAASNDIRDIETKHLVSPGLYTRTAIVPAGTLLISKTHLKEHQYVMSRGKIHMIDDLGEVKTLTGANIGRSKAGTRRVVYVEEEVVFTTAHPTTQTEIPLIEAELYGEDWMLGSVNPNHVDFLQMCKDIGVTAEQIRIVAADRSNVIDTPEGEAAKVVIKESPIHGQGAFAKEDIDEGERISVITIGEKRTVLGRLINHFAKPNVHYITDGNHALQLIASRKILAGEELGLDYRQAYKEALSANQLRNIK